MTILFDIVMFVLFCLLLSKNFTLSKKLSEIEKNQKILDENLAGDIAGIEKALVLLCEKTDNLPNLLQADIHRFLVEQRESLSTTRPIRPNNWDSMKEAFKGPTRIEINERN